MTVISTFEHQSIPLSGENYQLSDRHLRELEQLNRLAGVELVALGYKKLKAASYVGVIQLGDITLEILPKVGAASDTETLARHNLLAMLYYAGELPIHESELAGLTKKRDNLFELLIRIFCERLIEQIERGLQREYQRHEERLSVLKGRWLLGQQLRRQPYRRDSFYVAYDEFTPNIALNRILCTAVHLLHRCTRDAHNRQRLETLRLWFEPVEPFSRVTRSDMERVVFTRLNAAYEPVFELACMFLAQQALQLRAGHFQTFSFLLDMNDLFERFVAGFLRRHRVQTLPPSLQECEILTQGKGVTRWLAQTQPNGGRPVFRLKPDILFRQRGSQRVPLIVDTKYKTHDRIKESDAYQMLAYATRYQCNELLLLYPQARMQAQKLYIESAAAKEESICLRTQTIDLSYDLSARSGRDCLTQELYDALKGG